MSKRNEPCRLGIGAKRKAILKFKTGVLEKNGTDRKGDLKMEACYFGIRKMLLALLRLRGQ